MAQEKHQGLTTNVRTTTYTTKNQPSANLGFRKVWIVLSLLSMIGLTGWSYYGVLKKQIALTSAYRTAKLENQQAVAKNSRVYQEYQNLQDDEYMAQVARRDYYYSKNGEIIFILPEDANDTNVFEKYKN